MGSLVLRLLRSSLSSDLLHEILLALVFILSYLIEDHLSSLNAKLSLILLWVYLTLRTVNFWDSNLSHGQIVLRETIIVILWYYRYLRRALILVAQSARYSWRLLILISDLLIRVNRRLGLYLDLRLTLLQTIDLRFSQYSSILILLSQRCRIDALSGIWWQGIH